MSNKKLNGFPEFTKSKANRVFVDDKSGELEGYVFDGADDSQVVFWSCPDGGKSARHVHDYDEYCLVVSGKFVAVEEDGSETEYNPGDECYVPAGKWHQGYYSEDYRAIDVFGGKRVQRIK